MKTYEIKFFGSKNKKEQIKQVKMSIEAEDKSKIEDKLKMVYKFVVVNSLKIR